MANNGLRRRQQLFDRYSKHFALGDSEKREIFVCPLCLRIFTQEDCLGPNPRLTIAHFIPKKLGGKSLDSTLTCASCNNGVGTELEAALVERWAADDFAAGIGTMKAWLSGKNFGKMRVEYELPTGGQDWRIYGLPEQSNPKDKASLERYLTELLNDAGCDFQFSLTADYRHQPHLVQAALYHSAYLVMFAYFGYDFVFHPHFAPLREQIATPDKEVWKSRIFVDREIIGTSPIKRRCAVLFLCDPVAIVVILRLQRKGGPERRVAIVLPGLDSPEMPSGQHEKPKAITVPYRPDALHQKGSYLRAAWRYAQAVGA